MIIRFFKGSCVLSCSVLLLLLSFIAPARAGFFVKKEVVRSLPLPVVSKQGAVMDHRSFLPEAIVKTGHEPGPETSADDSYKGIVAILGGGAGILSLVITAATSSIGFLLPAFIFGMVGIVFGAMRKRMNKALGNVGLILGIVDVTLIVVFIVAVFVALASFT